MEKDTRDALIYAVRLLFRCNAKVLLEEWQQDYEKKPRKKWSRKKKNEQEKDELP